MKSKMERERAISPNIKETAWRTFNVIVQLWHQLQLTQTLEQKRQIVATQARALCSAYRIIDCLELIAIRTFLKCVCIKNKGGENVTNKI